MWFLDEESGLDSTMPQCELGNFSAQILFSLHNNVFFLLSCCNYINDIIDIYLKALEATTALLVAEKRKGAWITINSTQANLFPIALEVPL